MEVEGLILNPSIYIEILPSVSSALHKTLQTPAGVKCKTVFIKPLVLIKRCQNHVLSQLHIYQISTH